MRLQRVDLSHVEGAATCSNGNLVTSASASYAEGLHAPEQARQNLQRIAQIAAGGSGNMKSMAPTARSGRSEAFLATVPASGGMSGRSAAQERTQRRRRMEAWYHAVPGSAARGDWLAGIGGGGVISGESGSGS